jgi:DNA-binding NarL/FixJ family response regulator
MNILLADNRSRVRYALRVLLEQQPGWSVIGDAADANELFCKVQHLLPDLVLIDSDLPGLEAADWLERLRQICPQVRIVVLSEQPLMTRTGPAAFSDAFASKMNPPERLLSVIRTLNNLCPGDALT